ncbi:MAG: hypothetical protein K0R25_280 [Rickettsiaceae bacterium]|jgi:uncharacterized protein with beta-barrel porin domain|nr:hypothetical protein [Rickettsiaceae bacterium]
MPRALSKVLKPVAGFLVQVFILFFFSSFKSFAIDISSSQVGDIDLGASSSAVLNLNIGGVLTGNVLMGNSVQTTTFNGGQLNGQIDGVGKVVIAENTIFNGDVGSETAISSLTINNAKSLDLDTNNNSVSASSLNVGAGSSLLVGSQTILASIRGSSDNVGTVRFNASNNLGGSLGTSTTTLSLIEIAAGAILSTNTRNIDAVTIAIENSGVFSYGSGTIAGSVEGRTNGVGNFIFNNTKTTAFSIGQNGKSLASIAVADGATITLGADISASIINISGALKSNGRTITSNNINIASDATFDYNINSTISGSINGFSSGDGTLQFSGAKTGGHVQNQSIGAFSKLSEIIISNETNLEISSNIVLNADQITIGTGSTGSIGTPILTQNNGTIGADENSLIRLNSDSVFNYNGGVINGQIRGTSSNKGTFNINHDYTNNHEIGGTYDIANLNIAAGKTLTVDADISANNISLVGNLNLGNSGKTITGNLTTGSNAIIDLGSGDHILTGNFSTSLGNILKITALDNSNIGNLKISGNALVAGNTNLDIAFDTDNGYLSDGTRFAIIAADNSSSIAAIADNQISINNLNSNQSGLLTFRTEASGNNLFLTVDRAGAEAFTNNHIAATIYNNIDQIGSNAFSELRNLQKFIDSSSTNSTQKEVALKAVIPQSNQDLHNSALSSANASINVSENRLENILFNNLNQKPIGFSNYKMLSYDQNFSKRENIAGLNRLSFDEEIFDKQAIWLQGFSNSATQDNVGNIDGYDFSSNGLAIGADQEVDKDLRFGISASLSLGNAKSNSVNQKQTDIDSYQFNLYSLYNFAPYFVSGIVGMALNKYESTRQMPQMNLTAKASYSGETYIAKFKSGMIKNFDSGLTITPQFSLTMAKNQISTYSESGAGSLSLATSNESTNFLEGRIGSDLSYDNLKIISTRIQPITRISYGYDFLGQEQSSKNRFQGQSSTFEIANPNNNKASLKYGFGLNIFGDEGASVIANYVIEKKSSYEAKSASLYFRYDF